MLKSYLENRKMPTYKLHYFALKGRGEMTRLLFHLSGTTFEDVRIQFQDWPKLKESMPYGQLPVLEVDGKKISQSGAIARFVARRFKLYGKDEVETAKVDEMYEAALDFVAPLMKVFGEKAEDKKAELLKTFQTEQMPKMLTNMEKNLDASGFCVGKALTLGDIAVYNALDVASGLKIEINFDSYPHLKALRKNVESNPKLAKYLKERPQ